LCCTVRACHSTVSFTRAEIWACQKTIADMTAIVTQFACLATSQAWHNLRASQHNWHFTRYPGPDLRQAKQSGKSAKLWRVNIICSLGTFEGLRSADDIIYIYSIFIHISCYYTSLHPYFSSYILTTCLWLKLNWWTVFCSPKIKNHPPKLICYL